MEKIIGIVPPAKLFEDDIPNHDLFLFANPYIQQIVKQGATPLGILSADGYASEHALSLCDGFLLAGGNRIWPYHLQVIEHAAATCKPVLGICLGMQAIAAYFHVLEQAQTRTQGSAVDILRIFEEMKNERFMFNLPIEQHYLQKVTRETARHSRHPITIKPGTLLYDVIGKTQTEAVSLHSYQVAPVSSRLKVSAVAYDGSIEAVEYDGFIVGVQFHPEAEATWDNLFAAFVRGWV